jgi:formylglycine-generating enzyme required for sulfatase activity
VKISKSFYLMESEVTQALYEKVMGSNPSSFTGSKRPVETVSWYDAVRFANKLSALEGREKCYQMTSRGKDEYGDEQYDVSWTKNCTGWRLPTEAEWEYASRGGQSYKYAGSNTVGDVAWYDGNSGSSTHDVCGKQKNGYGLCDMSGNVWEWDWTGDYSSGTQVDPQGPTSGSNRVIRGGSWFNSARDVRVSLRDGDAPSRSNNYLGFRLGLSP